MAKQKNNQSRLFEFGFEIDEKEGKAELTLKSKGRIPTKLLLTLLSIILLVGLSVLAQISWVGRVVLDTAKKFFSF